MLKREEGGGNMCGWAPLREKRDEGTCAGGGMKREGQARLLDRAAAGLLRKKEGDRCRGLQRREGQARLLDRAAAGLLRSPLGRPLARRRLLRRAPCPISEGRVTNEISKM